MADNDYGYVGITPTEGTGVALKPRNEAKVDTDKLHTVSHGEYAVED